MIRFVFALLFMVAVGFNITPSRAGDTAEWRLIGFSADGVWFAFEEFGTSDGTGAPYANVYLVNTDTDTWGDGTPIRVNFGEDVAPISKARGRAMSRAIPILNRHRITEPGRVLASRPPTEISPNPRRIDFYRHASIKTPDRKSSYVLKQIDFKNDESCKAAGIDVKGFSLSYSKGGAPLKEVYKDKSVPKSRNCPSRYEISDVIELAIPGKPKQVRHIVMVSVYERGFEGPDIRYIAVPIKIELP